MKGVVSKKFDGRKVEALDGTYDLLSKGSIVTSFTNLEGTKVGLIEGKYTSTMFGIAEGKYVGTIVGTAEGKLVNVVTNVGEYAGYCENNFVGITVGITVSLAGVGPLIGIFVGDECINGKRVGFFAGFEEGKVGDIPLDDEAEGIFGGKYGGVVGR